MSLRVVIHPSVRLSGEWIYLARELRALARTEFQLRGLSESHARKMARAEEYAHRARMMQGLERAVDAANAEVEADSAMERRA